MKIYLVAQSSDEYSNTLQLKDVLDGSGLSPYWMAEGHCFKSMAFQSLDKAKEYRETYNGKPAHGDGSGNMMDDISIYETELSQDG